MNRNSRAAGYFIYLTLAALVLAVHFLFSRFAEVDPARFVLAFGFLYFLLTALSELTGYRWADRLSRGFFRTRDLYGMEDRAD